MFIQIICLTSQISPFVFKGQPTLHSLRNFVHESPMRIAIIISKYNQAYYLFIINLKRYWFAIFNDIWSLCCCCWYFFSLRTTPFEIICRSIKIRILRAYDVIYTIKWLYKHRLKNIYIRRRQSRIIPNPGWKWYA